MIRKRNHQTKLLGHFAKDLQGPTSSLEIFGKMKDFYSKLIDLQLVKIFRARLNTRAVASIFIHY